MPATETVETDSESSDDARGVAARTQPVLMLAWCRLEPSRIGEVLLLPEGTQEVVFGREASAGDRKRIGLSRVRPGQIEDAGPLGSPFVSRTQLSLRVDGDRVHVHNLGKRAMQINDAFLDTGVLRLGQTLQISGQLLFYCMRRPVMPAPQPPPPTHRFGEPDALGIVGESAATWQLRDRIAFVGARAPHVLILGESGTGKELVAQALHASSPRARHSLIARNAATFPAGLIDAELFGNAASYPNPGMPERPGVIGTADGSTLFLDEIGELPGELQAHLLRFLDAGGEYQRLGDSRHRTADIRVLAATNRPVAELKHDLAARFPLRIHVPSLNDRIEDVPLLVRHLLRTIAASDPSIGAKFFDNWDGSHGEPRVSAALIAALLAHRYTNNVRELESLLWSAMSPSTGEITLSQELLERLERPPELPGDETRREATADEIRAAMEKHGGVREKIWRELRLPNRYVLQRLMKRHGLHEDD